MSKMLLPPYSPVDRTVKPKTEHALWGKIASIYGFQYQLFRVLVGFPNNERVVNKTQAKTNIRLQSDHLNWFWCTVSLSKIQWRIGRKRQSLCLKFQIFTQWFLNKKLFHLNNNKVAIFKVYSRKRASDGGRISEIWKLLPALNRAHGWAHWICSDLWNLKWILKFFFTIITWVDFEFFSQDHVLSSPY